MKRLYPSIFLAAIVISAIAATVKISDLTLSTSPSTNTFLEIADMNDTPKSKKYLLTNLVTVAQGQASTNALTNTFVLKAGDSMSGALTGPSSTWTNGITAGASTFTGDVTIRSNVIKLGTSPASVSQINIDTTNNSKAWQIRYGPKLYSHAVVEGSGGTGVNGMGLFEGMYLAFQNTETNVYPQAVLKHFGDYFQIYATGNTAEDKLYLYSDGEMWLWPKKNGQGTAAVYLITGEISPFTSGTMNLGAAAKHWLNTYTRNIQGGATKVLTDATATSAFYIAVANTNAASGHVVYTVTATDGTETQAISGDVKFASVAKGTAVTAQIADVQTTAAVSAGTLTCAVTSNVTTNNVFALQFNADTSLTTTNLVLKWRLETPSSFTVNSL